MVSWKICFLPCQLTYDDDNYICSLKDYAVIVFLSYFRMFNLLRINVSFLVSELPGYQCEEKTKSLKYYPFDRNILNISSIEVPIWCLADYS